MRRQDFIPTSEPVLDGNERKYVLDCLKNNWISFGGKYTKKFEERFAEYVGSSYAIVCSSGTAALHLALLALGIGKGDEVIIPDFTIICSASMPILTGAKPVLVDVDEYFCLDPKKIEEKITKKTRAIMPVHMYGNPANMTEILKIARKYKLYIIEDACMAHGVEINSKKVGSIGDIGCFSFYSSKTIATGEGGMVVTNNKEIAQKVRAFRDYGHEKLRFTHYVLGFNYRITDIQAALGLAQLEKIEKKIKRRLEITKTYQRMLGNIKEVQLVKSPPWGKSIPWMYGLLINDSFGRSRDEIIELLYEKGIEAQRFFTPMHKQPVFKKGKESSYPDISGSYLVSEDIGKRGLYLPSGLNITSKKQERIVESLLSLVISRG